jgi:hypothetical protein
MLFTIRILCFLILFVSWHHDKHDIIKVSLLFFGVSVSRKMDKGAVYFDNLEAYVCEDLKSVCFYLWFPIYFPK